MTVGDEQNTLIGLLYDAALDPTLWREAGARLSRWLDARTQAIFVSEMSGHGVAFLADPAFSADAQAAYAQHFVHCDEWLQRARRVPLQHLFTGEELISSPEWNRTEIYNDFLRPQLEAPPFHMVGAQLPIQDGVIANIGFHRAREQDPFGRPETRRLGALLPHLQRAIQVRERLLGGEAQRRASLEALNMLMAGVVLLDPQGAVLFVNAAAEAMLSAGDGLGLVRGTAGLFATGREDNARLQRLIGAATRPLGVGGSGGAMTVARPSLRRAFQILVAPLAAGLAHTPRAAAIVFLSDPDRAPRTPAELLVGLFDFHPAEVRLVMRLIEGDSLADAAARLGVSLNTVRTQLTAIFAKVGCHRQSELIRIVASSPAYTVVTDR